MPQAERKASRLVHYEQRPLVSTVCKSIRSGASTEANTDALSACADELARRGLSCRGGSVLAYKWLVFTHKTGISTVVLIQHINIANSTSYVLNLHTWRTTADTTGRALFNALRESTPCHSTSVEGMYMADRHGCLSPLQRFFWWV